MLILRARLALLAFAAALFIGAAALAFQVDEPLPDPAQEARARELAKVLRCLVCQNQSIAESNAPLARDLRQIVRERIAAGESDDQVVDFLVIRYGDWVLLEPPLRMTTILLWIGPFAALALAAGGVYLALGRRRGRVAAEAAGLSDAEAARLAELLDDRADEQ